MVDNERIAHLTGDAIRVASNSVVKEITDAVVAAERVAGDLRVEADQLTAEINRLTDDLVSRINDFVAHCKNTSETIRDVRNSRIGVLANINKLDQITSSLPSAPERAMLHYKPNGENR